MTFNLIPFTELLSAIVDNRGRTCPVGSVGLPLIATNCVSNEALYPSYETTRFVDADTYQNWFRGHPLPGDILFVCKGSPGRTNLVPSPVDFCIAQDMVAVRADPKRVDPNYLFAVLRSTVVQRQIDNMHVGTLIPHFKKGDFDKLLIPLVGEREQRIIGDIYFSLSRKIDLNRRINQTLEAMAQAIFKSWFVDFDPVKAKITAKQKGLDPLRAAMTAISGKSDAELDAMPREQFDQLAATAALFPDEMEDSPLGEIPKGWGIEKVEDVSEKIAMGPFGSNIKVETFVNLGVPVISGQHLRETLLTDVEYNHITDIHADKLANSTVYSGDVVFTHAGNIGQVSLIPENSKYKKYIISQRQFYLRPNTKRCTASYLVYFFRSTQGQHLLLANASQVGVPSISRPSSYLKSIELVIPPLSVLTWFDKISKGNFDLTVSLRKQNADLATLRDTLLPKLLSGELSVTEATAEADA